MSNGTKFDRRNNPIIKANQWKPGQSGNPGGRPADPPELKKLRHLTKQELVEIGNLIIKGSVEELKLIAQNPKTTVIQAMIASVAWRAIKRGDTQALDGILNRMIGKVKDEVDFKAQVSSHGSVKIIMPSNGREIAAPIAIEPKAEVIDAEPEKEWWED